MDDVIERIGDLRLGDRISCSDGPATITGEVIGWDDRYGPRMRWDHVPHLEGAMPPAEQCLNERIIRRLSKREPA